MDNNPRIIHAPINGRRYAVTSPITQYDYGYLLLPEGTELPATYEIDFSDDEHKGTSLPVYGDSEGAEVPEELIRTGKDVFAFYYRVGEGYGKTEFTWRIPNHCRPSRDGETPTPSQQSSIDQLIVRSNEAVTSAEQSASDASASAQESAESARASANSAVQASLSESNAERAKGNAQASAESASASATTSAQSASEAETARQATTSLVAEAQGYANASEQSATASANSAEQAESAKGVAQSYAQDAQTSATYASVSESTANAKAQEASGYAQTASAKATESAQSASQALSYKTDAESAKTASQTAQGLAESARDTAVQAKTDAESARDEAQNLVDGISGKVEQIDSNTERIESLEDDRYKPYVVDSASGSIASFTDGADDIPLKSLIVNINPVQDLSNGDPSPENICPINGWTGMQLTQANENLIPESLPDNVISGTASNGKIASTSNAKIFAIPIPKNTPLHIQKIYGDASSGNIGLLENGEPQVGDSWINNKGFTNVVNQDYTANGYSWMGIQSYNLAYAEAWFTTRELMVSVGNTRKDYVAPKGYSTRHISWETEAGTVYGGKLDVLTGKLTVYPYYASYNGETLTGEWISDRDVYAVGTTPTIGAQVVNIGAEGTEYQLEPHEVASLLGVNNIWADTGDTACEYRADTKLYINRLTEPDADMIADSNIVSGQYFMVGNSLFKATANIASGAQVIVGTNATRKSLSEALNEINA